jgi:hypothetical protein
VAICWPTCSQRSLRSDFGKQRCHSMLVDESGGLQIVNVPPSPSPDVADANAPDATELLFRVVHLNPSKYKRPTSAFDNLTSGCQLRNMKPPMQPSTHTPRGCVRIQNSGNCVRAQLVRCQHQHTFNQSRIQSTAPLKGFAVYCNRGCYVVAFAYYQTHNLTYISSG